MPDETIIVFRITAQVGVDIPAGSALVLQRKDGSTVPVDAHGTDLEIISRPGGDIAGPWVSGPKGARFVYLGLPDGNGWSRRWKWRQEQILTAIAQAHGASSPIPVRFLLGKSVTPEPIPPA